MHVKPEGPFLVEEGQKLGGVKHGEVQVGLDLGEAADVPRGHEVRPRGLEVFRLPPSQGLGDLRLEEVVGPGGAAAELPLPGFQDLGARRLEKPSWGLPHPLGVGQVAGVVVGHPQGAPGGWGRGEAQLVQEDAQVLHLGGEGPGLLLLGLPRKRRGYSFIPEPHPAALVTT